MRLRHRAWGDQFFDENTHLIKDKDTIEDKDFESFLKNDSLRLEIGVGRGDFILNMAKKNPKCLFLGVEMCKMALAIAGKKILQDDINNLLLVNMDVHYLFEKMGENSFDVIYLNFSDPWPKKRQHKRRLTYPTCLEQYYRVLKPNGKLIFKTDNEMLFEDSVEYFESSKLKIKDLTRDYQNLDEDDAMTEYETKFRAQGVKIKRLIAVKEV